MLPHSQGAPRGSAPAPGASIRRGQGRAKPNARVAPNHMIEQRGPDHKNNPFRSHGKARYTTEFSGDPETRVARLRGALTGSFVPPRNDGNNCRDKMDLTLLDSRLVVSLVSTGLGAVPNVLHTEDREQAGIVHLFCVA